MAFATELDVRDGEFRGRVTELIPAEEIRYAQAHVVGGYGTAPCASAALEP